MVRTMGALLAASVCVTEGLLIVQGRWREAIPLHLCSVSAIAALIAAAGARGDTLNFLWYLGMPGAALALIFPAPAMSRCQGLFNAAYAATHLLIVFIPAAIIALGDRPKPRLAARMMALLQGIALLAFFANEALGTNFLFLSLPAAGTPLEALYAMGYPVYLLVLEGMMFLVCLVQSQTARWLTR